MAADPSALSARLLEVVTPSPTDIRRATRAVLSALEGGHSLFTGALVRVVCAAAGISADQKPEVRFTEQPAVAGVRDDEPGLLGVRWRWAALEAIAELAAQGQLVPSAGSPQAQDRRHHLGVPDRISISHPRGGEGIPIEAWPPTVGEAYRLSLGARRGSWYSEPTLFADGLESLALDDRGRRALEEALRAYRRGLYLAAASLLGVVSESAWYSAARRTQPHSNELAAAIDADRTAEMQRLLSEHFRANKIRGTAELHAQASLLRELRNYGVHPAGEIEDDLERWFEEETVGLLLLQTRHYLLELAQAVETLSHQRVVEPGLPTQAARLPRG